MRPIIVLGEARGAEEDRINSSFVGPSGVELLRQLHEAGVIKLSSFDRDYISKYYLQNDPRMIDSVWALHPEVYRTNVFQFHPLSNDIESVCGPKAEALPGYPALIKSKFVRAEFEPQLDRLRDEILATDPNLILCLGNTALWAMAGKTGIAKTRGTTLLSTHCVRDYKLLPAYHPSAILHNWPLRPTAIADLMKAKRESGFPEIRRPHREIWIEPDLTDIQRFIDSHVKGCRLLSVDIETSGHRVTCIGFAPSSMVALVVPFDDDRAKNGSYWPTEAAERECWRTLGAVLGDATIPKLFHNGLYDIAFLYRSVGVRVRGATEDSMLLSHAQQPESLKGLAYLGSIFSDEGAWKNDRRREQKTIKKGN